MRVRLFSNQEMFVIQICSLLEAVFECLKVCEDQPDDMPESLQIRQLTQISDIFFSLRKHCQPVPGKTIFGHLFLPVLIDFFQFHPLSLFPNPPKAPLPFSVQLPYQGGQST